MLIPKEWLSKVKMTRVICHWTAGTYQASELDQEHYHILIEKNGTLVRGKHSIADNVDCTDSDYAAHTGEANTRAIGVTVCCMANAVEKPFNAGKYPITEKQWDTLCHVVAELCREYKIPVNSRTVLGHGEVHANLGTVGNKTKWDPMVLPFRPELNRTQVGNLLRATVEMYLLDQETPKEIPPLVTVLLQGERFPDSFLDNGSIFVQVRPIIEKFGFKIKSGDEETITITQGKKSFTIPAQERESRRYVSVREIANALQLKVTWDDKTRTATVETVVKPKPKVTSRAAVKPK